MKQEEPLPSRVYRAPRSTPYYIMADTGAFIDALNEEDYETREHCNKDSHLLIEEPNTPRG